MTLSTLFTEWENWCQEEVGLFTKRPLKGALSDQRKANLPLMFVEFDQLHPLNLWINSERPRMVVIDQRLIDEGEPHQVKMLWQSMQDWGVIPLILSEHHAESPLAKLGDFTAHHLPLDISSPDLGDKIEDVLKERFHIGLMTQDELDLSIPDANIFLKVAERELDLAAKRQEEFSLISLSIGEMPHIHQMFGPIFAEGLQRVFARFIRTHVRKTDFVAKGPNGSVLILLSRVGRQIAAHVGSRLVSAFVKEATVEQAPLYFTPRILGAAHTFPYSFCVKMDLPTMILPVETPFPLGS